MRTPILVVALLVFTASAAAQVPPSDSARLAAVARLSQGTMLRLKGTDIGVLELRLRSPAGDTITVGRWRPERRIALAAVDSIWVMHSGMNTGAAIGAGVGGLILGALASSFVGGMCERSSGCGETRAFFVGAAIGAIVGGTFGAAFGSADKSCEPIYPVPR